LDARGQAWIVIDQTFGLAFDVKNLCGIMVCDRVRLDAADEPSALPKLTGRRERWA
jgi:hypothetical protein